RGNAIRQKESRPTSRFRSHSEPANVSQLPCPMKRLSLLLAVSGVANLLLAAVWLTSQPSSAVPATASPARPTTTASSASESVASPSPVAYWTSLTTGLGDSPDDDATLVA